jgi:hypothetical protein
VAERVHLVMSHSQANRVLEPRRHGPIIDQPGSIG